ncbi:MAG: hypothetical protein ACD_10C00594G0001 [uncultured bacterium]|nr:MAG: hypothetical protein ACD_10C00594G0001 [uncultured bacterium]
MFDRLDADRRCVNPQGAGRFTGRRADTAGEVREVVGRMQDFQRLFPVAAINQIVPVGNDVIHRTAVIAERNAAIHAARTLCFGVIVRQGVNEFLVIFQTLLDRLVSFGETLKFHETGGLTHYAASFFAAAAISVSARLYSCG